MLGKQTTRMLPLYVLLPKDLTEWLGEDGPRRLRDAVDADVGEGDAVGSGHQVALLIHILRGENERPSAGASAGAEPWGVGRLKSVLMKSPTTGCTEQY